MHKNSLTLATALFLGLATRGVAVETPAVEKPVVETQAAQTPTDETMVNGTSTDESLAVEQAARQFYANLNTMLAGDASGMDAIWSHADDITYMGPVGGIQIGWGQVRTMWEVQAEMKIGGHVEPMALRVTVGNDLALVEGYELGSIPDTEGRSRAFRIRATSSLRKENGQWRLIGHHTDLLESFGGDGDKASNEQPTVILGQPSQSPAGDDDSIDVSEDEVKLELER